MLNLSNLNEKQLEAVVCPEGPTIVVAGAGTGKTRVLTTRIAYLIEHEHFNPSSILAITFTNKAANEMKDRVSKLLNINSPSWIGTYHSICLRILKEDIDKLNRKNNFGIIDPSDQQMILTEIYKTLRETNFYVSFKPKKAIQLIDSIKFQRINIDERIEGMNFLKNLGMPTVDEYRATRQIFNMYQRKLLANNLLDFNDLLNLTYDLLSRNNEVQKKWASRFKYVLVDEFQDTNEIQFNILKFLINPEKNNIFVVGDPDQSIYKWRGAYEWIFQDFKKAYPNSKLIVLDTNYRSTKNILKISNTLIRKNTNRIEKELNTNNPKGEIPNLFIASDRTSEARFVVNEIANLVKEKNIEYSDIAVLYRSNYLSKTIEEAFINNGIPYVLTGGVKFYQRMEIKDLISYLKLMVSDDEISAKRIINVPKRNIGPTTIDRINQYVERNGISFFEALNLKTDIWNPKNVNQFYNFILKLRQETNGLSISDTLKKIIDKINYYEYLKSLDLEDREENIKELFRSIEEYQSKNPNATISSFLQDISLFIDNSEQKITKNDAVNLMTVHTAKGLEFKVIFLMNFSRGIFPAISSEDIEEERRIAYVALTRAKQLLYITCGENGTIYGNSEWSFSNAGDGYSDFLNEIGIKNLNKIENKFKKISNADLDWYDSKQNNFNYESQYEQKNVTFVVGDQIVHTIFGKGVIVGIDGNYLTIAFKAPHGVKTIIKNHKALKRLEI